MNDGILNQSLDVLQRPAVPPRPARGYTTSRVLRRAALPTLIAMTLGVLARTAL